MGSMVRAAKDMRSLSRGKDLNEDTRSQYLSRKRDRMEDDDTPNDGMDLSLREEIMLFRACQPVPPELEQTKAMESDLRMFMMQISQLQAEMEEAQKVHVA